MESFTKIVLLLVLGAVTLVRAQYYQDYTTPVPILKQINRHNEDGSYSYGYEAADGSFKIETKHPTGEVVGKYGYVDDTGNLREVEYGASRRGFEPAGTGINVAPPTLTQDPYYKENSLNADYDDGQYREDPSVYYKNEGVSSSPAKRIFNSRPSYNSQPSYSSPRTSYNPPAPRYDPPAPQYNPPAQQYNPPARQYNPPAPQYNPPAPQYNPPAPRYNPPAPQYNPPAAQQSYQPAVDPNQFRGHPAQNFDVYSGSYSVTYSG